MHHFCSQHLGQNLSHGPPGVKIWVINWIFHKQKMSLPHTFMSMSSLKPNNLERLILQLLPTTWQLRIISQLCVRNELLQPHFLHLETEAQRRERVSSGHRRVICRGGGRSRWDLGGSFPWNIKGRGSRHRRRKPPDHTGGLTPVKGQRVGRASLRLRSGSEDLSRPEAAPEIDRRGISQWAEMARP